MSCSNDYPDVVCRENTSLVYHDPPLLFNLNSDPGELYPLDTTEYPRVLERIEMVNTVIMIKPMLILMNVLIMQADIS